MKTQTSSLKPGIQNIQAAYIGGIDISHHCLRAGKGVHLQRQTHRFHKKVKPASEYFREKNILYIYIYIFFEKIPAQNSL